MIIYLKAMISTIFGERLGTQIKKDVRGYCNEITKLKYELNLFNVLRREADQLKVGKQISITEYNP